jgi:hypothetical protein
MIPVGAQKTPGCHRQAQAGCNYSGSLKGLLLGICLLLAADAAVFRSGLYYWVLEPDSYAGDFERKIRNERARVLDGRNQVLIVGNSRALAIRPRIAQELLGQRDFAFGNVAVPSSTPRDWYYLLRELDPYARRYRIILFGLDNFDDEDDYDTPIETSDSVRMPVSGLHLRDLFDYFSTFQKPEHRLQAFWVCLLKGSAYKQDFLELLSSPRDRWRKGKHSRGWYPGWLWQDDSGIGAGRNSLAGLTVDWSTRMVNFPPGTDPGVRIMLERQVKTPAKPQSGFNAGFRREWFGRIARHYSGSRSLLVFMRLPRSPIRRPEELAPAKRPGVLRSLAGQFPIVLLDERLCDELEQPGYFADFAHLNRDGARRVTEIAVQQLQNLGAPRTAD